MLLSVVAEVSSERPSQGADRREHGGIHAAVDGAVNEGGHVQLRDDDLSDEQGAEAHLGHPDGGHQQPPDDEHAHEADKTPPMEDGAPVLATSEPSAEHTQLGEGNRELEGDQSSASRSQNETDRENYKGQGLFQHDPTEIVRTIKNGLDEARQRNTKVGNLAREAKEAAQKYGLSMDRQAKQFAQLEYVGTGLPVELTQGYQDREDNRTSAFDAIDSAGKELARDTVHFNRHFKKANEHHHTPNDEESDEAASDGD